jgi:hypothetical protein
MMGINEHDLSRLNSKVQGRVMVPGDDGYDSARA